MVDTENDKQMPPASCPLNSNTEYVKVSSIAENAIQFVQPLLVGLPEGPFPSDLLGLEEDHPFGPACTRKPLAPT